MEWQSSQSLQNLQRVQNMKPLLLNPDSRIYRNVPNISLAYTATKMEAPVIDLNAAPSNPDRYLDHRCDRVLISVRSNTERSSILMRDTYLKRYPQALVATVRNCIDVLCCYPFVGWQNGIEESYAFDDKLPIPNYELFDSFQEMSRLWKTGEWAYSIMTSVGCPFGCVYCASRRRGWKTRSVAHCREELTYAKTRWGIRRFDIIDDCFNVSKDRVLDFCDSMERLGLTWTCANGLRADCFDEDIAKALKKSGCRYISFGVESVDDSVLKLINKGETFDQIDHAVTIASRYFPGRVNCFFIIGLPGSSYDSDRRTLTWAIRKGISMNFSYFVEHGREETGDRVFNGDFATPQSDSYDKRLQQRIYDHTNFLRVHKFKRFKDLGRIIHTLRLIMTFDPWRLPVHIVHYAKLYIVRK
jgi:Radical SAM superfamily